MQSMSRLSWDETEFVEVLEVIPEIENYEVHHRFDFVRGNKKISLLVWQLESFIQIQVFDEHSDNSFLNVAFYCRGESKVDSKKGVIYFLYCVFVENRFSYIENIDVFKKGETPCGNKVIINISNDNFKLKIV